MLLSKIQFVYFFNGIIDRPDKKYITINENMNNLFDGFPTILPYTPDLPLDFPIVQLKSSDGKFLLNLAKKRCDFIINFNLSSNINDDISMFYKYLAMLSNNFNSIRFSRIGIVGDYILENLDGIKQINSIYLKKNLANSTELLLRFNEQSKWCNTKINNITTINNVSYNLKQKKENGILIQKDINTVPTLQLNISIKEVEQFIKDTKFYFYEKSIKELF